MILGSSQQSHDLPQALLASLGHSWAYFGRDADWKPSPLFSESKSILSRDEKPNPQKFQWARNQSALGVRKGETDSSQTNSCSRKTLALPTRLTGSQDLRAESAPRNQQKTNPVKRSSKKRWFCAKWMTYMGLQTLHIEKQLPKAAELRSRGSGWLLAGGGLEGGIWGWAIPCTPACHPPAPPSH